VLDNVKGSSINDSPMFAMSGDGTDDVSIPMLFLFEKDAKALLKIVADNDDIEITMQESFRKFGYFLKVRLHYRAKCRV
jgi:mannosidase alpha-like ER degradation enhancer 3